MVLPPSKTRSCGARAGGETEWLEFGNSRLDVAGQVLYCGSVRQNLTFRETKLLPRLFADSPDRLLEREYILRHVWEDEGCWWGAASMSSSRGCGKNWRPILL
ncbi:MAG: response regulator transcription factor [Saprospirales bacterium]|nr:response regulator transcription factor [Saprospirales bacterium]